jgi:hypothetical protein
LGADNVGYGGGIYSISSVSGLRYFVNLTFSNNVASSGKGNDVADGSVNVFDHYTEISIIGCTSASSAIKFYAVNYNISLDCLFDNDCPTDYFYVSTSGVDFPYCGASVGPCLTLVIIYIYMFWHIFICIGFFYFIRITY